MDEKLVAALIAFLGVIIAALVSLYWNFRSAKASRKLPFLNRQLEYCFEASEMAARLATADDPEIWKAAHNRFFELLWGPLAIVEDDDVAGAMMNFALALDQAGSVPLPAVRLQIPSLDLSAAIRKLLLRSWSISDLQLVLDHGGGGSSPQTTHGRN